MSRPRWMARLSDALPLGLAFLAEGSWLAVLAALVQGWARSDVLLGLPAMSLLVAGAALVGWLAAPRLGAGWPVLGVALVAGAPIGGVLVSTEALAAVLANGLAGADAALAAHPAGLLAGLAVLRGTAYSSAGRSAERLERLLGGGLLVIVAAALVGAPMPEPWRARFIVDALFGGLAFAACGAVALALRRQALEGGDRGADWQRNPVWVVTLVVVAATIAATAASSAGLVRPTLELLIGLSIGPLLVLGLIFGWTRRGVAMAAVFAVIAGLLTVAFHLFSGSDRPSDGAPAGPDLPTQQAAGAIEPLALTVIVGVALVVAVVALYLLVRWWARRANVDDDDPLEVRFIDRPTGDPERARRHWLRRLGWTGTPTDAAAAYRQLLREIDHREVVARQPSETPREHARRLREVDVGGLPLELLAADHALAAFGGVRLSQHEERRALARWRTLRRTLRAPSPPPELPER